jgi:hypothetical protein
MLWHVLGCLHADGKIHNEEYDHSSNDWAINTTKSHHENPVTKKLETEVVGIYSDHSCFIEVIQKICHIRNSLLTINY